MSFDIRICVACLGVWGLHSAAFFTLEDIYNQLNSGTTGIALIFTEPTSGPAITMHTLTDIMNKVPVPNHTTGAAIGDVRKR